MLSMIPFPLFLLQSPDALTFILFRWAFGTANSIIHWLLVAFFIIVYIIIIIVHICVFNLL